MRDYLKSGRFESSFIQSLFLILKIMQLTGSGTNPVQIRPSDTSRFEQDLNRTCSVKAGIQPIT